MNYLKNYHINIHPKATITSFVQIPTLIWD